MLNVMPSTLLGPIYFIHSMYYCLAAQTTSFSRVSAASPGESGRGLLGLRADSGIQEIPRIWEMPCQVPTHH